jgi:hypothetical protein
VETIPSPARPGRRALQLLVLAAVVASPSCGRDDKGLSPVRGQVFFEGRPTDGATVYFHLQGGGGQGAARAHTGAGDDKAETVLPSGKVGPDGSFELAVFRNNKLVKGAPPGRYAVTVSWTGPAAPGDGEEANLLPWRYMYPGWSQLMVEIKDGKNELPPFQLTK